MAISNLLDLPIDIIVLVTSYLEAADFLHLTATCKALRESNLRFDAAYWSALTKREYRVPSQPVVSNDGLRWMRLFKRMRTQSRVFTWGFNNSECLGDISTPPSHSGIPAPRQVSWPQQVQLDLTQIGVISDVQCGGFSTTFLNARGSLYTMGSVNAFSQQRQARQRQAGSDALSTPTALRFPAGYPNSGSTGERYEPTTAVKQFSCGRLHVLALADSGRIWSWSSRDLAGYHVKFLHHDIHEGSTSGIGAVKKVVAGWNKSAALVHGIGIVLWETLERTYSSEEDEDTALVMESTVIPYTSYMDSIQHSDRTASGSGQSAEAQSVGEVCNFLVLEEVVLFCTSSGCVYVAQHDWDQNDERVRKPVQVHFSAVPAAKDERFSDQDHLNKMLPTSFATDVQGSFRSFAIFTRSGNVLIGKQDDLFEVIRLSESRNLDGSSHSVAALAHYPRFDTVPSLQDGVIQIAFGDYHYHALHADGRVTSYGHEPQGCGALGLGGNVPDRAKDIREVYLRGMQCGGASSDCGLPKPSSDAGRQVWYEPIKHAWLRFMARGGCDPEEAQARLPTRNHQLDQWRLTASDWIERNGGDWETKYNVPRTPDDDNLPAYFTLSVAAAGWHSAALVLVNEGLALRVQQAVEVVDTDQSSSQKNAREEEKGVLASLFKAVVSVLAVYVRSSIGLPPRRTDSDERRQEAELRQREVEERGISPRKGVKYVWANDHYPRLRLSDGTEMPGTIDFDN